mmetsp:Transcript_7401/g.18063  ORF Transcript_7401/g.18063 Transcript_7401/m.18063 type:complete len:212 (-) Transcript_7401:619-1254(-)
MVDAERHDGRAPAVALRAERGHKPLRQCKLAHTELALGDHGVLVEQRGLIGLGRFVRSGLGHLGRACRTVLCVDRVGQVHLSLPRARAHRLDALVDVPILDDAEHPLAQPSGGHRLEAHRVHVEVLLLEQRTDGAEVGLGHVALVDARAEGGQVGHECVEVPHQRLRGLPARIDILLRAVAQHQQHRGRHVVHAGRRLTEPAQLAELFFVE